MINITVNHRKAGLNSIEGFLATSEDEEYNAGIPRHLDSTVAWICWDQMTDNNLRRSDNDAELAIKATQREYKLRKTTMYMRKYANDEDVTGFVAQVDNLSGLNCKRGRVKAHPIIVRYRSEQQIGSGLLYSWSRFFQSGFAYALRWSVC